MSQGGSNLDPKLTRIVTALAAVIALAVGVVLPAAYFLSTYATMHAEIAAEGKLAATAISGLASSNPELWMFENARVRGLLSMLGPPSGSERRIVTSGTGQEVAAQGDAIPQPVVAVVSPLYDSGAIIGSVEIQRSLQKLLVITAIITALAGSFGAATFAVLRSWPLRLLSRALARSTHLATHDTLTGLPNRALFRDRLEQSVAWSRREGAALAVLYLDLDRFKEVNDTLGHAAGDHLLTILADRLRACVRETDTLARLGGDEFAIAQVGARQLADTEMLAQRLIDAVDPAFDLDGNQVTVGVSVGIALRSVTDVMLSNVDAGILLQEADMALYRAKEEGRGVYRFFAADMNQKLLERRALEADILEAISKGQFRLHYQPQMDLARRKIVGAEALLRWHHPLRGDISPEAFIPLAEETGLIGRIGEWVLHEACRQAALWPDLGCIAVNVSPVQFRRACFVDQVKRALEQTGLDAARLEIEITEGVLLNDTDETLATLRRLRGLGITIAMDDFGTGYSSLGYLQKFRFDKIKIDQSFVRNLEADDHAAAIVRAVLRMSHALGIRVNAEGVEHEYQAVMLQEEGCEEVQGFLFSRAIDAAAFAGLLAQNTRETAAAEVASVGSEQCSGSGHG
jgi:diguanylate cyclase (GGDEF)-like protein